MTVCHFAQMLLKLEKCIPISHVTLETVPKYANIERQANFMPVFYFMSLTTRVDVYMYIYLVFTGYRYAYAFLFPP